MISLRTMSRFTWLRYRYIRIIMFLALVAGFYFGLTLDGHWDAFMLGLIGFLWGFYRMGVTEHALTLHAGAMFNVGYFINHECHAGKAIGVKDQSMTAFRLFAQQVPWAYEALRSGIDIQDDMLRYRGDLAKSHRFDSPMAISILFGKDGPGNVINTWNADTSYGQWDCAKDMPKEIMDHFKPLQ